MDAVFKALADPTRRQLLDLLFVRAGLTLGELCLALQVYPPALDTSVELPAGEKPPEAAAMSRQAVSKHLRVLEAANLVVVEWRGREKRHFLNPIPIQEIYERWIGKFEREKLSAILALKHRLEKQNDSK